MLIGAFAGCFWARFSAHYMAYQPFPLRQSLHLEDSADAFACSAEVALIKQPFSGCTLARKGLKTTN
jgi:hypothetical protein